MIIKDIIYWLIGLLIAVSIVVGIYKHKQKAFDSWQIVQAKITTIEHFHVKEKMHHTVKYEYELDGRKYFGSANFKEENSSYIEGDMVSIWYNPENKRESSLLKPTPGFDPVGIIVIIFFPVIIVVIKLLNKERFEISH